MLKILIVDDESIERRGIHSLIKRYKLPLEVFEESNGRDALAFLQEQQVDIVLTDIKMPFMDGLQLTARATALYPELKVVIFSAYDEFDYAKQAVQLDVVHYLLKPIVLEEFQQTMERVISLCLRDLERRRREAELLAHYQKHVEHEQAKQLLDLLSGTASPAEIDHTRGKLDIEIDHAYLLLADTGQRFFDRYSIRYQQLWKQLMDCPYRYLDINENQSVLIVPTVADKPERSAIAAATQKLVAKLSEELQVRLCIAVGGPASSAAELPALYAKLEDLLEYRFFWNESVALFLWEKGLEPALEHEERLDSVLQTLECDVDAQDYDRVACGLDLLFAALREKQHSIIYTKYIFITMLQRLYQRAGANGSTSLEKMVENAFTASSLDELRACVSQALSELRSGQKQESVKGSSRVLQTVKTFITNNYQSDISLERIASEVYLSPGYLSAIFKKETGQSLMKYITQVRLEKARDMLLNSHRKVADIAESVGFSDASYFGMVFRNHYGLSPARYKEKLLR